LQVPRRPLPRLRQLLLLVLREPFRALLNQQPALLPKFRIRINLGEKIPISPDQHGGHGSELNIRFQPVEDGIVDQV
jgi:hypothetical protein